MSLIDLIGHAGPGSLLARRPAGVAHVTTGPLTPSRRFVAAPARTVCRAHNRRLTVLPERFASLTTVGPVPVRLCASCVAGLSTPERPAMSRLSRDDLRARYRNITVEELVAALAHSTTTEETHRISRVALTVFDPPPVRTGENARRLTREQHDLVDLHDAINKVRSRYRTAELTQEQRDAIVAKRQADTEFAAAAIKARRREVWKERQAERDRLRVLDQTPQPLYPARAR